MSDAMFYEVISQVDDFSETQKKSLIKALKKSLTPTIHLFSKKKDKHLVESLVGIAGTSNVTIEEIKAERLADK